MNSTFANNALGFVVTKEEIMKNVATGCLGILLLLYIAPNLAAQEAESQQENINAEVIKPLRLDRASLSGLGLKRVRNVKEPERELFQTRLFMGKDISVYVVSSETATNTHESYGMEEYIQILSGRARLKPTNGEEVYFNSGDRFVAPKGYCGEWQTQGGDNEYLVELSIIATKRSKAPVDTKPLPVRVDPIKLSGVGLTEVESENDDGFMDAVFKGPELEVTLHAKAPESITITEPLPEQMISVLTGSITLTPMHNGELDEDSAQTFFAGDHFVLPDNFHGKWETKGHRLFRWLAVKKSK